MIEKIKEIINTKYPEINYSNDDAIEIYFGLMVVNSINYWIEHSSDYIDNKNPSVPFERKNEAERRDRNFRECFAKIDNESKAIIKNLIQETVQGVIFSTLVKLDQPPVGKWEIRLLSETEETEIGKINPEKELHNELYNWINLFKKKNT